MPLKKVTLDPSEWRKATRVPGPHKDKSKEIPRKRKHKKNM